MEYPNFSPDLDPNDFWLFPEIKSALKVWIFKDIDIQKSMTTALKAIPKQEFQKCLQEWHAASLG
jgi:hypothetical protein